MSTGQVGRGADGGVADVHRPGGVRRGKVGWLMMMMMLMLMMMMMVMMVVVVVVVSILEQVERVDQESVSFLTPTRKKINTI